MSKILISHNFLLENNAHEIQVVQYLIVVVIVIVVVVEIIRAKGLLSSTEIHSWTQHSLLSITITASLTTTTITITSTSTYYNLISRRAKPILDKTE